MQPRVQDFTDLIESAQVVERTSNKTGNKYNIMQITLEGGIVLENICMRGEENVIRALALAADAADKK